MDTFAKKYGLHPLAALVMVTADVLLVGEETIAGLLGIETGGISLGIAAVINIVILAILAVGCIMLQRYSYKDNWGAAIGKGIIVGVLTGVPGPFLSAITFGSGVVGIIGMVKSRSGKKAKAQSKKSASSGKTKE